MPTFDVDFFADSNDEIRALYQALMRARASERTEVTRLNKLLSSGYGNDSTVSEHWRADARERMLDRLIISVFTEMQAKQVESW